MRVQLALAVQALGAPVAVVAAPVAHLRACWDITRLTRMGILHDTKGSTIPIPIPLTILPLF